MPALTAASFLIYIKNRSNTLSNIYWETTSGFSYAWANIATSNGKQKQTAVGRPTTNNITITKAANTNEDPRIAQWLNNFCLIDELGDPGSQAVSGDSLILVPRTTCKIKNLVDNQIIFYNISPVNFTGWDGDLMNTTAMSRVSLELSYTRTNLLPG